MNVELATKAPVDVPPPKTMALVVVLPALVTIWKFDTVPVGQFVPSNRQMFVLLIFVSEGSLARPVT